ncbi:MAG: hypothetical protein WEC84_00495, partial [Candidatus Andersenbacteria bacterium]
MKLDLPISVAKGAEGVGHVGSQRRQGGLDGCVAPPIQGLLQPEANQEGDNQDNSGEPHHGGILIKRA